MLFSNWKGKKCSVWHFSSLDLIVQCVHCYQYNIYEVGGYVCIDDSICNELLYNKTRGSLISNCVVKITNNSGFGENFLLLQCKKIST